MLTSVTWLRPEPYKFKWPNFFWKLIVSFVIYRRQILSSVSITSLCWVAEEWWRGRWEVGSGWGTHVNPWLIHVNVWQKPPQYCKVISLQLIKINGKKKKSWIQLSSWAEQTTLVDFQGAGRCCCWIAKSCPALRTPWTAAFQASMSLTISQRQQVQTQIMLTCWSDTYPCSLEYTS